MHPSATWLVAWLAGAAPATPATSPAPAPVLAEFRAARVDIVGFDEPAILAALRLRLPRIPVERHGGAPPADTPHVYLQIARGDGDAGRVRAITSDGRAYERGFVIEVGQEVRVAASTATNLLFSIEEGVVTPVEENVEIPVAAPEPAPAPEPPPPQPEPAPAPAVVTPPPLRSEPPAPAAAPWELTATLHAAAVLGLGRPRHGGAFAGAGGGLGLELRSPRGGLIALDLRGLGRLTSAFAVGRVRIGLAGGYAWRRGRFELPVALGLTVEPWFTARNGAAATIFSGDDPVARAPLIGGLLRVTPAVRLELGRGSLAAVRIGPRLELAGSFAVADGLTAVGLTDASQQSQVRLGGLELALGLDIALQWRLPARR